MKQTTERKIRSRVRGVSGMVFRCSGVQVFRCSARTPEYLNTLLVVRLSGSRECRIVIGLVRNFRDILYVLERSVRADHENGAGFDAERLDQRAIGLAECGVPMVRSRLDVVR